MGHLAILWHLHQPDYRDPATGRPTQPWTRLHALRGYRDLCLDILRDETPATVNVVPSLVDQLVHYAAGGDDPHLALTVIPAEDLDASAIADIRATFVCGHPTLIAACPAWKRLGDRIRSGDALETDDLRDAQVWSTLAWCGSTALRDFPELAELRRKAAHFTEDDKVVMLGLQRKILGEFPGVFARIAASGTACLSTSPYFHPILPLLIDTRHARRCMPWLEDDAGFAWPEDALLQLTRARSRMAELVGRSPIGLWPSEGSVSPEVVELAARAGFRWLASDDAVLRRSDTDRPPRPGGWDLGHGVTGFFRDHDLSDRLGFDAARQDPRAAAYALIAEAAKRAGDGTVLIALDGENPWEAYADAGDAVRRHLHEALRIGPIRGITLDRAAGLPTVGRVKRLHTGSWIRADFGIWYGHADDRCAWRLLADARRAIDAAPAELRAAAMEHILPAEGSDWTWWYGDDFDTPFLPAFDFAFRRHVAAAWRAIGAKPPPELDRPVSARILGAAGADLSLPRAIIDPVLAPDAAWARWAGAGTVRIGRGSSMARAGAAIDHLIWGWSTVGDLWVHADFSEAPPLSEIWTVSAGEHALSAGLEAPSAEPTRDVIIGVRGITARFARDELPDRVVPLVLLAHDADGAPGTRVPADGAVRLPRPAADPRLAWWLV